MGACCLCLFIPSQQQQQQQLILLGESFYCKINLSTISQPTNKQLGLICENWRCTPCQNLRVEVLLRGKQQQSWYGKSISTDVCCFWSIHSLSTKQDGTTARTTAV